MNFKKIKQAYFIGIKGVGMTMLAQFLASYKVKISGSDLADTFITDKVLAKIKAPVYSPYNLKNINQSADLIVYTSALNFDNNEELDFIKKNKKLFKNTLVLNYAQALALIFNKFKGVAVCGSHGKTTVTAWLGYVLKQANISPQVLVGSYVDQFKGSILTGKSKIFLAEVDEYQNKLQYFYPQGVILNNIDYDHPDFFKNRNDYYQVFHNFLKKIPQSGFLVANIDDPLIVKAISNLKVKKIITYSFSKPEANLLITKKNINSFELKDYGKFNISLNGDHNIYNALAVLGGAMALGVDIIKVKRALNNFTGTARRSQLLGYFKKCPVYDDYAHHPTELKASFKSLKERYPNKRIVVLFHPHTFTRTKALFDDFVTSFDLVDVLGVLPIYGSAREKQGGVSSQELIEAIKNLNNQKPISYLKDFKSAINWLKKTLSKNDILLLVGAGDVFRVGEQLIKK